LAFFPENLGIPLFLLACAGIVYCLFSKEQKALLLLAISLPLYVVLELSSVKVNRFALDLMPLLCLFAAIFIRRLWMWHTSVMGRVLAWAVFTVVFVHAALYSIAWADVIRPQRDIRREAAQWVMTTIPIGSQLGIKTRFWLEGSPDFLPGPSMLPDYQIARYVDYPDYVLLPKLLFAIMAQYAELTRSGYIYQEHDWTPMPAPDAKESMVLLDLVEQQNYQLLVEFHKVPLLWGMEIGSQSLHGRTWFLEHLGAPYGIQVYKKRVDRADNMKPNL